MSERIGTHHRVLWLVLILAGLGGELRSQVPDFRGSERTVNTLGGVALFSPPDLALGQEGEIMVVWASPHGGGGGFLYTANVFGRVLDATGEPVAEQMMVNTNIPDIQEFPQVVAEPEGFLVVWHDLLGGGSPLRFRRYGLDGEPEDGEVLASEAGFQPALVVGSEGGQLLAWQERGNPLSPQDKIGVRPYAAGGGPTGPPVRPVSDKRRTGWPALDALPEGGYVLVWELAQSNKESDVEALIVDSEGVAIGPRVEINSLRPGFQGCADVAASTSGEILVVWLSEGSLGSDQSSTSIQGRLLAADGSPLSGEFQINTVTEGLQACPHVAADPFGGFLAVWASETSADSDAEGDSIQGRRIGRRGRLLGQDFQINSITKSHQRRPVLAIDPIGLTWVAWVSAHPSLLDEPHKAIELQQLELSFFVDGFEAADLEGWSVTSAQ